MTEPSNQPLASDFIIDPLAEQVRRLRVALAGATLLMVGLSGPLWMDLADFPAIPFVSWYPTYPIKWSGFGLVGLALSLGLALIGRVGRFGLTVSIPVFLVLILGDQLRFQPWVYQYLVMALLLVALPSRQAVSFCRTYLISMYIYSGLSKIDVSFLAEMGPLFLRTLARVMRFDASHLIGPKLNVTVFAMPVSEIVIALLLMFPGTRRIGFVGLIVFHSLLLVVLGPWGLGHSTIVLVWNLALGYQEYLLFWLCSDKSRVPVGWSTRTKLVGLGFSAILLMPLGERWGLFDSWPSHALYASHCERSQIILDTDDFAPDSLKRQGLTRNSNLQYQVNLTTWSRAVRGVPIYPQCRYANGVAEWLSLRHPVSPRLVRVNHHRRADPFTGARLTIVANDLESIRDEGEHFWFNAHPRSVHQ